MVKLWHTWPFLCTCVLFGSKWFSDPLSGESVKATMWHDMLGELKLCSSWCPGLHFMCQPGSKRRLGGFGFKYHWMWLVDDLQWSAGPQRLRGKFSSAESLSLAPMEYESHLRSRHPPRWCWPDSLQWSLNPAWLSSYVHVLKRNNTKGKQENFRKNSRKTQGCVSYAILHYKDSYMLPCFWVVSSFLVSFPCQ